MTISFFANNGSGRRTIAVTVYRNGRAIHIGLVDAVLSLYWVARALNLKPTKEVRREMITAALIAFGAGLYLGSKVKSKRRYDQGFADGENWVMQRPYLITTKSNSEDIQ